MEGALGQLEYKQANQGRYASCLVRGGWRAGVYEKPLASELEYNKSSDEYKEVIISRALTRFVLAPFVASLLFISFACSQSQPIDCLDEECLEDCVAIGFAHGACAGDSCQCIENSGDGDGDADGDARHDGDTSGDGHRREY